MTKIELAREIGRRAPARIVEIERTRRGTAYRNMLKRYSAKAALSSGLFMPGSTMEVAGVLLALASVI